MLLQFHDKPHMIDAFRSRPFQRNLCPPIAEIPSKSTLSTPPLDEQLPKQPQ